MSHQDDRETTNSAERGVQSAEKLSTLLAALIMLDETDLQRILIGVPAYQLARALEFQLRKGKTAAVTPAPPIQQAEPDSDERRKEGRSKTLRNAKIIFNNKMSVVNCIVRDITSNGCQIRVESTTTLPKFFTLHIMNGDIKRECEVAWRNQTTMGLKFID